MPELLTGFGNHFVSESVKGALSPDQNNPQPAPYGLYAEQISGTAFTAPRQENRRSWFYRLRPSADHPPYVPYSRETGRSLFRSAPFEQRAASPNRRRWAPVPLPSSPTDFVDGVITYGGNGDVAEGRGMAAHAYAIDRSMERRVFVDADGELLFVPQYGELIFDTEFGSLDVAPRQIVLIPRGVKFRVRLKTPEARGYLCENYGAPFRLPELGPIGSNGLANPRDFEVPHAAFEDLDEPTEIVQKFQGTLWTTTLMHSPLDVVAWHGNLVPYRYDLRRFNAINTVTFDHPDPSIFTVLTSPSEVPGTANCDFVIFPPRWMVAEKTFRPPWFHRNIMSEFMGLIYGTYDAKADGFLPGGASLHNCMSAHGPDLASYQNAISSELQPVKIEGTMAFMFESRAVIRTTEWAEKTDALQPDYDRVWLGFPKARVPA